jgi:hypothetical protein
VHIACIGINATVLYTVAERSFSELVGNRTYDLVMTQKVIQAGTIKKITRIWVVQAETTENHLLLDKIRLNSTTPAGELCGIPLSYTRLVLNGALPLAPIYSSD